MYKIKNFSLKLTYLLLILYSIYDIMNSASAGNKTDNRSVVYVFLFAVVIVMALSVIFSKCMPINGIVMSFILFSVYYILDVTLIKGTSDWRTFVYFGLSAWWIVTIWFFYKTTHKNINQFTSVQKFIRVMFVIFSIAIVYGSVNIKNNFSVEFSRVGYVYYLLSMLPMVMLEKNKKIKNIFLIVTIILTIFSFKRGAIIVLPIMLFLYFAMQNRAGTGKNNLIKILAIIICLIVAWFVIDHYSNGFLSSRFSSDELSNGSGRIDTIKEGFRNIAKRDFYEFLVGKKSYLESAMSAGIHNEWIGFLYSYGFLGLLLFVNIFINLISKWVSLYKKKSVFLPSFTAMLVYMLGISSVSGLYFVHSTFYLMLYIGIVLGMERYDENKTKKLLGA